MIYFFIWCFLAFLAIFQRSFSVQSKRILAFIVFLILTLLFGLRYRVGGDTINYMRINETLPSLSEFQFSETIIYGLEPLYIFLTAICKEISDEFYIVQIFQAALLNYAVIRFFNKYTFNIFLGLFLYFSVAALYFNTEIIRESIAIAIFLLNIDNLINRKWISYYSISFISVLFHLSALFTFILPYFLDLKFNKKLTYYIVAFLLFVVPIAGFLSHYFTAEIFAGRVEKYMELADSDRLNVFWVLFAMLKFTIFPAFALYLGKKFKYNEKIEGFVCLYFIIGVGCIFFQIIFSRFANYLTIFFLAYAANILSLSTQRSLTKYRLLVCSFLVGLLMVYLKYHADLWYRWYPYHSIYDPITEVEREA